MNTGGDASGGVATGGLATGGVATGGVATGGVATGGLATGGVATGGDVSGGAPTGGIGTGGGGNVTGTVDPWQQAARLGRGVNMGNMLDAPTEGAWGETVEEEYFGLIAGAGFTNVRIPIRWNAHAATSAPYTIDSTFLNRVDQVVEWALDAGLAVIINIHHYEELWADPEGERPRFLGLWDQIATHFADRPGSLMMEIVNEPTWDITPTTVNSLLADAVAVIRPTNPDRTLLLGGYRYNAALYMDQLAVPPGETNVIGTFHMYEPFNFTHSGAEWVVPIPAAGAVWNGTAEDQQFVDQQLAYATAWSNRTGMPVHMGEFGAYQAAEQASRERWTRYVVQRSVELGIPFSYWEFSAGFGVYDNDASAWNVGILAALLE